MTQPSNEPLRSQRVGRWDLVGVAVAIGLVLCTRSSLADHYQVPSGSMQPSVDIGDRVLVDKAAYGLRLPLADSWLLSANMPARGDVVVLRSPESGDVLLKRVVAIANDTVVVRDGRIEINGEAAQVDAASEWLGDRPHLVHLGTGGPDFGPATVPEGSLLVMGDNRDNSHDGRAFGFVPSDSVLGRVVAVFYRHGKLVWLEL